MFKKCSNYTQIIILNLVISLQKSLPPLTNPADFYMDSLGADVNDIEGSKSKISVSSELNIYLKNTSILRNWKKFIKFLFFCFLSWRVIVTYLRIVNIIRSFWKVLNMSKDNFLKCHTTTFRNFELSFLLTRMQSAFS